MDDVRPPPTSGDDLVNKSDQIRSNHEKKNYLIFEGKNEKKIFDLIVILREIIR